MPKPGSRHKDAQERRYGDFRGGGLNLSASEFLLKENEYAECKNAIYERNGGRIRSLEPLESVLVSSSAITSLWYSQTYGVVFACGKSLYRVVGGVQTYLGALSGEETPVFCDWGEEEDRRLYVASGSVVQWYDGSSLQTQTPVPVSPNSPSGDKWNSASDALVREGRLLLARSGRDRLKFTGIGDPENWQTEDTGSGDDIDVHTDADAVWLDVGYKQGGDIIRVVPVTRDLMIFRSDGSLYRLSGSYPDWTSMQVGNQVSPVNRDSIVSVGDDAMFVDRDRGLRKVSAADTYNDLAITEKEGERVNAWLANHVTGDCRAWVLPDRGEIWVRPNAGNSVLTYNTRYEGWNMLDLDAPVTAVCEADGVVLLALGARLCRLNDAAATAWKRPELSLSLKPVFSKDRVLCELMQARIAKDAGAAASLSVGDFNWTLSNGRNTKQQLVIGDALRPVFAASGGTAVIDEITMRCAEVV